MKKIIFLGLFISNILGAQTNGTSGEQSTSKIKVYSPSSSVAKSDDFYKWTVKTDIFSFISGEFPIIGEYRIGKKLSVEASAGITYSFYDNFGIFQDEFDGEGTIFDTKAGMGTAFRGGIKFYPSSDYDAIEGWAFGLQFFSRKNNREYNNNFYSNNSFDLAGEKDSKTKTGIALTISKQLFWNSNISFEYMLGIGFASVTHDYVTEVATYDSATSTTNYHLNKISDKETVPNFQFGCRIGFGN